VNRLPGPAEAPADEREDQETAAGPGGLLAGFRSVLAHRTLRAVVALLAAQTLVAGAFNVLTVVAAIDLLHSGSSGLGLLLAACGIGGLVGALPALVLGTRSRLSLSFAAGLLLWGLPIAVLGLWPNRAAAFVLLGLIGVGNTLVDVAGNTLLQRAAPEAVLARVFGVLESATMVAIAVGAALAPLLVSAIGARAALVAIGALLPVGTLLCWRRLSRLDTPDPAVLRRRDLLARVPILGPLPPAVRERLALAAREEQVAAGATVFRQGDLGDRFYAVAEGSVDVEVDGRFARRLGVGDVFGEIALLHASPRTATVVAREPTTLYTLERSSFLAAVSAPPASAAAAEVVVGSRLGRSRLPAGSPDGAPVAAAR
jgi:MFS family permease